MVFIDKIVNFYKSITLTKIISFLFVIAFILICALDVMREVQYRQCRNELVNIRPIIVNDICNKGEGNYDFCILKKAEYTYTEGKYGN